MPKFRVLNGRVTFDREVKLHNGGVQATSSASHNGCARYYEILEYRQNTYVQLWSAPVNIRAHNLKIKNIGDILEFGWVKIISESQREWVYRNGHVVKESVANLPTWDTTGIGPWYQEVYWSTAAEVDGREQVKKDDEVDSVFFNDKPWTPPYSDLYEHNGVPLGRLHYYSPQRRRDQLEFISGMDKYIACLAFTDESNNWEVPWHVCWQVLFLANVTTGIGQRPEVMVARGSKTQVYSKQAGLPHSLLLNVLGKDGSEDSKNYEDLT
jgi:hypothetical protein